MNHSQFVFLQQPFHKLVALENLLMDATRRLRLAMDQGLLVPLTERPVHLMAGGRNAVLAWNAPCSAAPISALHDPLDALPDDALLQAQVRPMQELADLRDGAAVLARMYFAGYACTGDSDPDADLLVTSVHETFTDRIVLDSIFFL